MELLIMHSFFFLIIEVIKVHFDTDKIILLMIIIASILTLMHYHKQTVFCNYAIILQLFNYLFTMLGSGHGH